MNRRIKLYTDFEKVKEAKSMADVNPLVELLMNSDSELWEYYEKSDTPENSDFLVIALSSEFLYNTGQSQYIKDYLSLALHLNKKLIIFSGGDAGKSFEHSSVIAIRLGGNTEKLSKDTYIMSPFIEDPLIAWNLKYFTLNKTEKPEIGFVGHASNSNVKWFKELLIYVKANSLRFMGKDSTDFQSFYPSSIKRYHYLRKLSSIHSLKTDFILRGRYRAGKLSQENRKQTTLEFYNNIQRNLYTFCLRGAGNFSVRFYETLALGRIPILINTKCRLPFPEQIMWENHAIILDDHSTEGLESKITSFHNQMDTDDLKNIQEANRNLWLSYFTKASYFIKFSEVLKTYL